MPNFVGCRCCEDRIITHRLFDESGNLLWSRNLWKEGDSADAVICRDGQSVIAWSPAASMPNLLRKYSATKGKLLHTGPVIGAHIYQAYNHREIESDNDGNVYYSASSGLYSYYPDLTSRFFTAYPSPTISGGIAIVAVSPDGNKIAVLLRAFSASPVKAALWEFDSSGNIQWELRWSGNSPPPPWTVGYDVSNTLWTACYILSVNTRAPDGGSGGPYEAFVSYDSSGGITGQKYGSEPEKWTATDYSEGLPYKSYNGGSPAYDIYDPDGSGTGGIGASLINTYPKSIWQLDANTTGDKVAVSHSDGLYFYPSDFSSLLWNFPETVSSSFDIDCIDGLVLIGGPLRSR